MGPKKDVKKGPQKGPQNPSIEEPLNTDSWKCVVMMAVERTLYDCFVLKEFMEEFSYGRRQEVALIDFDTFLMKILKDFAAGQLQNKYLSLLNFSPILQEANEYVSKNIGIPAPVLAKVVKVLLFYLKDESVQRIEKRVTGSKDSILAMAERPANFAPVETKKKEPTKKTDNAPKIRPPSVTKEDTKLLKRGEGVKDEYRIDDAPLNGYFNLYVLLSRFYNPELPLELLKVGVPLHGLLCIDTSHSGIKNEIITSPGRFQTRTVDLKLEVIQNFWDAFLKILWDPKISPHFKDTIFQVYVPRKLLCPKDQLRQFIYREISYLLYDMSDFMRQLDYYLKNLKLWDVEENECKRTHALTGQKNVPTECESVPLILQRIIDTVCGDEGNPDLSLSSDSIDSLKNESRSSEKSFSLSAQGRCGSQGVQYIWSQAAMRITDLDLLTVYHKTKELDVKYGLDSKSIYVHHSQRTYSEQEDTETLCDVQFSSCGKNMEEALAVDGAFKSYWKKYDEHPGVTFVLDYCVYPLLMTRVLCPYLANHQTSTKSSHHSLKKNSTFQIIENLSSEMRKPHFTITDSSRSILKALPYNMKDAAKDFFSPPEFKVVSPEKLKVSSAPQFRISPTIKIHRPIISEIFPDNFPKNLFENLRHFLGECFFPNAEGFDFLELLDNKQLLERKKKYWDSYDCIDHTYSIINDCIFIVLHNRTEGENIHHETFNEVLKTKVGLRDFYEYVLDDDAEWLMSKESLRLQDVREKSQSTVLEFSESDMWVPNSIKFQQGVRLRKDSVKAKSPSGEKAVKNETGVTGSGDVAKSLPPLQGYDISDVAVQFSGLKTVYYSNNCSMRVELRERLYGNQELGIHITARGHTLHLYSYVCPQPHITDPFTFHITYKNGIIVAFTRRFVETLEEIEEIIESRTTTRGKKNSSELSTRVVKRQVPKYVRDEEFIYDMAASLPNGLSIRTVRSKANLCYIVQRYLVRSDEVARLESSRLFLPNGDVVRMLNDGTVEVLKPDTSTVTTSLGDIVTKDERLQLDSFRLVSADGYSCSFQNGRMSCPTRLQILNNIDFSTNCVYSRRRDGTNFMLQSDGCLCTQFKDGTKISKSVFVEEPPKPPQSPSEYEFPGEDDSDSDFLFVHTKITAEHPDYATVSYDSSKQEWTVLLPQESTITIHPDGKYCVSMDNYTELRADESFIQVSSYASGEQLECAATADLSVFEGGEGEVYCHMEDLKGKIFIVEANSNCYILDEEISSESESQEELLSSENQYQMSLSEFVASADLQCSPSVHTNSVHLSHRNRYFVLKRDLTGYELLHSDEVNAALSRKKIGDLIFSDNLPGTDGRLFLLITPERIQTCKKWQVPTTLPDPVYKPTGGVRETSSTYGSPPSWMHPFPKRKLKFTVPQPLSCRIFIETKKTDLSPPVGEVECSFCEIEEAEIYQGVPSEGVEEYLTKLTNNDQNLLTEIYTHVAESIINRKKKLKPVNTYKIDHYLCLSRYYLELQELHKRCIRYHRVPNYFHHPIGISWLILNSLIDKLPISEESQLLEQPSLHIEPRGTTSIGEGTSEKSIHDKSSATTFSNEEIEYMSLGDVLSFSDLTYRSDLSAKTAPPVLRTTGLRTCKIRSTKDAASAPVVKCYEDERTPSLYDFDEPHTRVCDFQEDDIEMLSRKGRQGSPLTLQDLMFLGLV